MTSFAVYQNGLTGSVPSELGNLVKIESNHGFRLSYCKYQRSWRFLFTHLTRATMSVTMLHTSVLRS